MSGCLKKSFRAKFSQFYFSHPNAELPKFSKTQLLELGCKLTIHKNYQFNIFASKVKRRSFYLRKTFQRNDFRFCFLSLNCDSEKICENFDYFRKMSIFKFVFFFQTHLIQSSIHVVEKSKSTSSTGGKHSERSLVFWRSIFVRPKSSKLFLKITDFGFESHNFPKNQLDFLNHMFK